VVEGGHRTNAQLVMLDQGPCHELLHPPPPKALTHAHQAPAVYHSPLLCMMGGCSCSEQGAWFSLSSTSALTWHCWTRHSAMSSSPALSIKLTPSSSGVLLEYGCGHWCVAPGVVFMDAWGR
jgi:hypothetical protein